MKLLVYGAGDFGRTIADLLPACGHEFAGFVDDVRAAAPGIIGGFEAVRTRLSASTHGVVLAVGYRHMTERWRIFNAVRAAGYAVPALIHPSAYVRDAAAVGAGSVVMARAIVDVRARIGEACVLWPGANVSHDSVVGDNSFLSPSCTLCGFVTLGRDSFVGAGAVIVDHRELPAASFVKAGSVYV